MIHPDIADEATDKLLMLISDLGLEADTFPYPRQPMQLSVSLACVSLALIRPPSPPLARPS